MEVFAKTVTFDNVDRSKHYQDLPFCHFYSETEISIWQAPTNAAYVIVSWWKENCQKLGRIYKLDSAANNS